eukprot:6464234-Pyramimonas_sp.AAC.2
MDIHLRMAYSKRSAEATCSGVLTGMSYLPYTLESSARAREAKPPQLLSGAFRRFHSRRGSPARTALLTALPTALPTALLTGHYRGVRAWRAAGRGGGGPQGPSSGGALRCSLCGRQRSAGTTLQHTVQDSTVLHRAENDQD